MPIRRALPADAAAAGALVRAAYLPYVEQIGREPAPMQDDYARRVADGQLWVFEEAGDLLGVLVLVDEDAALLLDNVAVAPAAQGRRLGHALLAHAEAEAVRRGYRAIRLYTNALMHRNIALYRHLGYVETGRSVEHGFHRVNMRKALPP